MTLITTVGISASAAGINPIHGIVAYAETCFECDQFLPIEGYRHTCIYCI